MSKDGIYIDEKELEDSIRQVEKALDYSLTLVVEEVKTASIRVAYSILGKAMRRAPKREGTLRGSGIAFVDDIIVAHTKKAGGNAQIIQDKKKFSSFLKGVIRDVVSTIVFNVEYATVQHEREDFNHTDGEAKFLEKSINENIQYYIEFIIKKVHERLDEVSFKG